MWFERPIKYNVTDSDTHRKIIESFLFDFFGFAKFKQGQYEAIMQLLNSQEKSLCIMPTGGGKSLVFYMLVLLQPGPSLIVSPTEILVEDQIRNLNLFHSINDVQTISAEDRYIKGHFSRIISLYI